MGVSAKTLRRWEAQGLLIPERTSGNQRRYAPEKIADFNKTPNNLPVIGTPHVLPANSFPLKKLLFVSVLVSFLVTAGAEILANKGHFFPSFLKLINQEQMAVLPAQKPSSFVLAGTDKAETSTSNYVFTVNVPAEYNEDVNFLKKIIASEIDSPNVINSVNAGSGISVSSGQSPTIANTGVLSLGGSTGALSLAAGSGISVSGLTITNSGIISLTAGSGISVSGATITNSDTGSAQYIFKTLAIAGQTNVTADANADTLTLVAGNGIILTTDAASDKITITGNDPGWTDSGTTVRLTTLSDNVGIGVSSSDYKLHVA